MPGDVDEFMTGYYIRVDRVSYDDLLLDIWVAPDGALRVLDEDEVRACSDAGLINGAELSLIQAACTDITAHHVSIIASLAAFESPNRLFPCADPH